MYLNDAHWVWPLLKAVAEGETLQHKQYGDWVDMKPDGWIGFSSPSVDYRTKPKVPEYRLFRYSDDGVIGLVTRNNHTGLLSKSEDGLFKNYEQFVASGTGTWITDWLPIPE